MDIEKIEAIAYKAMGKRKAHIERETGFTYNHGKRVAALALSLYSKLEEADQTLKDIIYVGALFHDLGKGIGEHAKTGSILVREILKDNCTKDELDIISQIIGFHNKRGRAELPDFIKVVQDADILDHMGSMEIWLNFLYTFHEDKGPDYSINFWNEDFFKSFVADARKSLNFDFSKAIYDDRVDFELKFIERFMVEGKGGIFNK